MIRQEHPSDRDHWLLISQIQHAELSAVLAARWANWELALSGKLIASLADQDQLLDVLVEAIRHHDDGWLAWDADPAVDPLSKVPLSFEERTPEDSHAIWWDSIQSVVSLGPLAAWVVAEHFLSFRRAGVAENPAYQEFLDRVEPLAARWRATIQSKWELTDELLDQLRQVLPFFDRVSLRLCATPWQSFAAADWNERVWRFRAGTFDDLAYHQISVQDWPFDVSAIDWAATASVVPRQVPESTDEGGSVRSMTIRWRLMAG